MPKYLTNAPHAHLMLNTTNLEPRLSETMSVKRRVCRLSYLIDVALSSKHPQADTSLLVITFAWITSSQAILHVGRVVVLAWR